ncbi:sugar transferase [Roseiconus lacunae]|nr:sugar transferase [Roseiconus lacunae]
MLKRCFDFVIAGILLLAFSPILMLTAILVRWNLGSPILFRQRRPGLDGRPFELIKFRTMLDSHDRSGNVLPDEQRLTRFGRFLRSTSIDELPELINVLRGEMSLVGPRPLLMEYLERYDAVQARRHEARPGITGWAQVNGRNTTAWEERLRMDVWYVDNRNLWLDIQILFQTIVTVFSRKGIAAEGHATMPAFIGQEIQPRDTTDENS